MKAISPATWEAEVGESPSEILIGQKCETLSEKLTKNKRTRNVAQVGVYLPSKK
jgi:hypothetical protein